MPSNWKLLKVSAHAVYVDGALARRSGGSEGERLGRDMNVGGKQSQIRVVAAVQRQFHDLLGIDDLAVLAGIGIEHLRRADNRDRLGHLADLKLRIHALPRGHVYFDIRRSELGEAGMLNRDRVGSHFHVEETVIAGFVRGRLGFNGRVLVRQSHSGA